MHRSYSIRRSAEALGQTVILANAGGCGREMPMKASFIFTNKKVVSFQGNVVWELRSSESESGILVTTA